MKIALFFLIPCTLFAGNYDQRIQCQQRCKEIYDQQVKSNDKKYKFDESGNLIKNNNEDKLRSMEMKGLGNELQRCLKNC